MSTNIREALISTYGPIMDCKTLCKVLWYPSAAALLAAKARGRLPFKLAELKGRRGYFALTEEIAEYLQDSFAESGGAEGVNLASSRFPTHAPA